MLVAAYKSWSLDRTAEANGVPMQERKWVALWMAPFGGVCGGNTFLCAKTVAELIKAQARGEEGIFSFAALLIVSGLVVNLLMQVRFLNEALRRFDILLIVPVYQTFWILSVRALHGTCLPVLNSANAVKAVRILSFAHTLDFLKVVLSWSGSNSGCLTHVYVFAHIIGDISGADLFQRVRRDHPIDPSDDTFLYRYRNGRFGCWPLGPRSSQGRN